MVTIGIDLGTTNSVVAVCEAGRPRVIANEEGQRVTPSVVGFVDDREVVVGAAAKRQAITNAERTVVSVKRLMGRRFEEVEPGNSGPPLVADASGGVGLSIDGRLVSPQFISSRILAKLKRAAENALGEAVNAAVITVPAYFDDAQRQATRQAAEIAGLEVRRLVNEPTAAALALATESPEPVSGRIVVYDLGGGTFDVSVLDVSDGVVEVLATSGDTRLGGDDMDLRIVDALADRFASEQGGDLRSDRGAMQRLRDAAERAKRDLGVASRTEIHVPFITNGPDGPRHLHAVVTRAEFEQLVADLVGRTIACCERVLEDAGLTPAAVDDVLLVGGATRVPIVAERVERLFGRAPLRAVNPDEAVALGAAVQAAVLDGAHQDVLLLDVTPLSLGVETRGGLFTPLIERNTSIPTRATKRFSTVADNQSSIEINVLQGERPLARDNRSLGRFELGGIPPRPRGESRIEVEFRIDANGVVNVSAQDLGSGNVAYLSISESGAMPAEEVARLVSDAERAVRADSERRALIERRNALESTLLKLRERIESAGDSLSQGTRVRALDAIAAGNSALSAEILDENRYLELNSAAVAAATDVEDELLSVSARARANGEPRV